MKYALILLHLTTVLLTTEQETPGKKFFPETDPTVRDVE